MNTMQIGYYRHVTYHYGGFRGVTLRDVSGGSFAERMAAAQEETEPETEMETEAEGETLHAGVLSEADRAFLREHYTAELTAVTVVEAVCAVYTMGGMSRSEFCGIRGLTVSDASISGTPATDAPLWDFHSLDDIFDWLEKFRLRAFPLAEYQRLAPAAEF